MGHLEHDLFVATSWRPADIEVLRSFAAIHKLDHAVFTSSINGYRTITIPTSGSNSGWPDHSAYVDALRVVADLADRNEAIDWAWIAYGGCADRARVVRERRRGSGGE